MWLLYMPRTVDQSENAGIPAADILDETARRGHTALQVHGVGARTEPLEVRWRNLRIRELSP